MIFFVLNLILLSFQVVAFQRTKLWHLKNIIVSWGTLVFSEWNYPLSVLFESLIRSDTSNEPVCTFVWQDNKQHRVDTCLPWKMTRPSFFARIKLIVNTSMSERHQNEWIFQILWSLNINSHLFRLRRDSLKKEIEWDNLQSNDN